MIIRTMYYKILYLVECNQYPLLYDIDFTYSNVLDNLFFVVSFWQSFCFSSIKFFSFMILSSDVGDSWPFDHSQSSFPLQFPLSLFWFLLLYIHQTLLVFWSRNRSYFSVYIVFSSLEIPSHFGRDEWDTWAQFLILIQYPLLINFMTSWLM